MSPHGEYHVILNVTFRYGVVEAVVYEDQEPMGFSKEQVNKFRLDILRRINHYRGGFSIEHLTANNNQVNKYYSRVWTLRVEKLSYS